MMFKMTSDPMVDKVPVMMGIMKLAILPLNDTVMMAEDTSEVMAGFVVEVVFFFDV